MYNQITLLGHLTRDVEIRNAQSGTVIASTAIATTHKWKGQDGQSKEEVMFIDLTFFGRSGEIANQYLHKGSKVFITGRLKLDQWTDQNGNKRSKHNVIVQDMKMLDCKPQQGQQPQQQPQYQPQPQPQPQPQHHPQPQYQQQYQPQAPLPQQMPEIDMENPDLMF